MPETATISQEERKAPTLEEVWALIRELTESQKETDRQMKETDKRMDELWKKTNKTLSDLGLRFGEIVEHLIAPNLIEKFNDLGFDFSQFQP
jgi:predicted transcriptional regulator